MKAQFWSIDAVFAMVIFTGAMLILSIVWLGVSNQFSSEYSYGVGAMQFQLIGLVQKLQSQGTPPNWDSVLVSGSHGSTILFRNATVGLEYGNSGELSVNKIIALEALSNINYQATKQILGVGYDYYIRFYSSQYNMSIGMNPIVGNAVAIQTATVPVILNNGQSASMQVMVWTNTSFGVS